MMADNAPNEKVTKLRTSSTGETPLGLLRIPFFQWMSRIMGYSGRHVLRNYYEAFGYKSQISLEDYLMMYLRNGVATRIIDAPVDATWSDPPVLSSPNADFMARWQDLTTQQHLWHRLTQLDRITGLGQYGVMVIGIDDGLALTQEVRPQVSRPRNCIYLQPYMQRTASIATWDSNPQSPRFGKPVTYRITPQLSDLTGNFIGNRGGVPTQTQGTSASQSAPQPFYVHHSRILHVADHSLENDIFGVPRLQAVFNWLDDLLKVIGGSAETYWLTANRGITANVDKEMDLDPADADALSAELDEFVNEQRRILRTRGVDVKSLGSDVADPLNNVAVLMQMISATSKIPQRVLMGAEAGTLASTQDRANWSDRQAERVADYGEPVVLLPLIKQLIAMNVLPHPESLTITWPEAYKLSPLERGQTSAQMARSAANLQKQLSDPIKAVDVTETTVEYEYEDVPIPPTPTPEPTAGGGTTTGTGSSNTVPQATPKANEDVFRTDAFGSTTPPNSNPNQRPKSIKTTVRRFKEGGQTMFTLDEARQIVGFGKTMPVFNSKNDSKLPKLPKPGN